MGTGSRRHKGAAAKAADEPVAGLVLQQAELRAELVVEEGAVRRARHRYPEQQDNGRPQRATDRLGEPEWYRSLEADAATELAERPVDLVLAVVLALENGHQLAIVPVRAIVLELQLDRVRELAETDLVLAIVQELVTARGPVTDLGSEIVLELVTDPDLEIAPARATVLQLVIARAAEIVRGLEIVPGLETGRGAAAGLALEIDLVLEIVLAAPIGPG